MLFLFKLWVFFHFTGLFVSFFYTSRFFKLCRKDKTVAVHYWNAKDASSSLLHLTKTKRETHVGCAWVLLHTSGSSSKNISSSGHYMCPLPYKLMRGNTNWPHRAGTEATHHMNVRSWLSIMCGNVSLWSSKWFDVSVLSLLSPSPFLFCLQLKQGISI